MQNDAPQMTVRQYFEHPPRSHLYNGGSSPTGATSSEEEMVVKVAGEEAPPPASPAGTVSVLLLTGLMYTLTMSGAYGIEESVMGGGALLTMVSLLVIPLIMGIPTALVVTEMSAAVPSNAGFLMWVKISTHRTIYLTMSILSLIYIALDNALYPTMFSDYVCTVVSCSRAGSVALRLSMLGVVYVLNLTGVETVGAASVALTILTTLPFLLMFVVQQLRTGFYINWRALAFIPASIDWATFLCTASWNLSGLEQAGTVAENVKDPQRTIIQALIRLMGLALVTYLPPVVTGASISRGDMDLSAWTTGYWTEVSYQVGGSVLRFITTAGSVLSAFGLTLSATCTTSYVVAGMALTEAFPGVLGVWMSRRNARFGTYHWSLTFNVALTALFSTLWSFDALVKADQSLYGVRVLMIFFAFYQMRWRYPHLPRPFVVPLEGWKLHAMMGTSIASFLVLTLIATFQETETMWLTLGFTFGAAAVAALYCHFIRKEDFLGRVVTEHVPSPST